MCWSLVWFQTEEVHLPALVKSDDVAEFGVTVRRGNLPVSLKGGYQ